MFRFLASATLLVVVMSTAGPAAAQHEARDDSDIVAELFRIAPDAVAPFNKATEALASNRMKEAEEGFLEG